MSNPKPVKNTEETSEKTRREFSISSAKAIAGVSLLGFMNPMDTAAEALS